MGAKHITAESYGQIKALADAGVTPRVISQVIHISKFTVTRVKNSSDFKDYKQKMRAQRAAWMDKKVEQNTNTSNDLGTFTYKQEKSADNSELVRMLQNIDDHLTDLDAKIEDMLKRKKVWF